MKRPLGAALGSPALLVLCLAGCAELRALETSRESFDFEAGASPRVEVRLERGRVEVEASTSGRIELEVRKRARGLDRAAARAVLDALDVQVEEVDGGVRVESLWGRARSSLLGELDVEILLRVPERSELDLRTGDGSIDVERVEATLSAETADGSIALDGVSGAIRARTSDGSIRGRALAGDVDARTADGRIELEGSFDALDASSGDGSIRVTVRESAPKTLQEGWSLRTADGSIRLRLPANLSADVEASTLDGGIEVSLPRFTGERRERRARGRIGEGGALILLTTMDGSVRIEES